MPTSPPTAAVRDTGTGDPQFDIGSVPRTATAAASSNRLGPADDLLPRGRIVDVASTPRGPVLSLGQQNPDGRPLPVLERPRAAVRTGTGPFRFEDIAAVGQPADMVGADRVIARWQVGPTTYRTSSRPLP